jgi:hypothetical protein
MLTYERMQRAVEDRIVENHVLVTRKNWNHIEKSGMVFIPKTSSCFSSDNNGLITHIRINLGETGKVQLLNRFYWGELSQLNDTECMVGTLNQLDQTVFHGALALKFKGSVSLRAYACDRLTDLDDGCFNEIWVGEKVASTSKPYFIRPSSLYGIERKNGPDGI